MVEASPQFRIGVMTMDAEGERPERFADSVRAATKSFEAELAEALGVRVDLLTFPGPHLVPAGGGYSPLDFLRIGLTEKLDRGVHFLLIVTEVELAAQSPRYTLALPSRLTNVAVISTKRLRPEFRGGQPDEPLVVQRLTTLLLHSFGHLLNLGHAEDPYNAMHDAAGVEDLAGMRELSDAQREAMRRALPREAHERSVRGGWWKRICFTVETLFRDRGSIARAVIRANPFRLLTRLPTVVTAALSVIIFIFFSPEPWDVGSTVDLWQLLAFSAVAVVGATAVLYRTFALGGVLGRGRVLAESSVVTAAAVLLSLGLTMLLLFGLFMGLTWLSAVSFFPRKLMETWPTVDPAARPREAGALCRRVGRPRRLAGRRRRPARPGAVGALRGRRDVSNNLAI